jgi:glycosyltransferase involved in cell wall biosynthesis
VIHPPVDLDLFRPRGSGHDGTYLLVGGFVPYKREDIVLEAFRRLDRRLVVAGDGPDRPKLERRAPPNVQFLGHVSDARLAELYAKCRALIFPQEEDFGLVALEAQACGRPVIAFARGGATESVVPLDDPGGAAPTGTWFSAQTPEALAAAVREFEREESRFDPAAIRAHAERFGAARFRRAIAKAVDETVGRLTPELAAATS